jgi:hypothetical protein
MTVIAKISKEGNVPSMDADFVVDALIMVLGAGYWVLGNSVSGPTDSSFAVGGSINQIYASSL